MQFINKHSLTLKLFGFIWLAAVLQGCTDNPGSWKNDQIKSGKREDFHKLNEQVFKGLKANDIKQLRAFLSKDLIDNDASTSKMVEHMGNYLNDNSYTLLDEYYIVNKFKDADTIKTGTTGINSYSVSYYPTTREMYIVFFIPKTGNNKYMITFVYANYDYGWKISQWDLSPYTINDKTAPELFKLAKEEYSKNYLIDAVNNMALATTCLKPSGVWQYPNEEDISNFYGKLIDEANGKYKFPFTISGVPTKPRIFRVFNQTMPDGTYPMIYYLSSINLKDTVAIKKENDQIKKVIGKAMPGIDIDKKYILYSAFNEKPNGVKTVDHFDINQKLP